MNRRFESLIGGRRGLIRRTFGNLPYASAYSCSFTKVSKLRPLRPPRPRSREAVVVRAGPEQIVGHVASPRLKVHVPRAGAATP